MGSKLRRLRVQAEAAGLRYQSEQRKLARAREQAERLGSKVAVSSKHPGIAAAAVARPPIVAEAAGAAIRLQERRIQLAHLLGSHDGASELADAIHTAAVAQAHASLHPNQEVIDAVWEQSLAELRRGVPAVDLTVLRSVPDENPFVKTTVRGDGDLSPPEPVLVGACEQRPPTAGLRIARGVGHVLPLLAMVSALGGLDIPKRGAR